MTKKPFMVDGDWPIVLKNGKRVSEWMSKKGCLCCMKRLVLVGLRMKGVARLYACACVCVVIQLVGVQYMYCSE